MRVASLLCCAALVAGGSYNTVGGSFEIASDSLIAAAVAEEEAEVTVGSFEASPEVVVGDDDLADMMAYSSLTAAYDASYDQKYAYHNEYHPNKLVTTGADGRPVHATGNLSPKAETYAYYEEDRTSYDKASWWETYEKDGPSTPVDTMYNVDGEASYEASYGSVSDERGADDAAALASLEAFEASYEALEMRYDYSYDQTIAYHNEYHPNKLVTTGADGRPVHATGNLSPKAEDYAYYEEDRTSYDKASWWETYAEEGGQQPVDAMYEELKAVSQTQQTSMKKSAPSKFLLVTGGSVVAALVAMVGLLVHRRATNGKPWTHEASTSRLVDEYNPEGQDFEISFV
jgi:hypothetical protein